MGQNRASTGHIYLVTETSKNFSEYISALRNI